MDNLPPPPFLLPAWVQNAPAAVSDPYKLQRYIDRVNLVFTTPQHLPFIFRHTVVNGVTGREMRRLLAAIENHGINPAITQLLNNQARETLQRITDYQRFRRFYNNFVIDRSEYRLRVGTLNQHLLLRGNRRNIRYNINTMFYNPYNMSGVNFSDFNLSNLGNFFANVDLTRANLSNTNLSNNDFNGANLAGANLTNANLAGADLMDVNGLTTAIGLHTVNNPPLAIRTTLGGDAGDAAAGDAGKLRFRSKIRKSRRRKSTKKRSRRRKSTKKRSRRRKSVKKRSRRRKSVKKRSRRRKSVKKRSRRRKSRKSVKKRSRRRKSIKKQSRRRKSVKKSRRRKSVKKSRRRKSVKKSRRRKSVKKSRRSIVQSSERNNQAEKNRILREILDRELEALHQRELEKQKQQENSRLLREQQDRSFEESRQRDLERRRKRELEHQQSIDEDEDEDEPHLTLQQLREARIAALTKKTSR